MTTTGSSATPGASLALVSPLVPHLPVPSHGTLGASPGKSTCPALKPSILTCRAIQLSGFPILCRVTHSILVRLRHVPRHPLGFLQTPLLPVAPLPAGYLPAGWAVGFLSTHRLGRHAGHTEEDRSHGCSLEYANDARLLPALIRKARVTAY